MKTFAIGAIAVALGGAALAAFALAPKQTSPMKSDSKDIYSFKVDTIEGKSKSLADYKGKVLLVVNTASKCGLTPQYEGLEKLYKAHKEEGLVVLGFPANEFAGQEPGTNEEIKEFCSKNYGVSFPMFSKVVVKGENTHPLYQWLLAQTENHNDIEWNFAKFVVGKDGKVIARFAPKTAPDDPKLIETLKNALAAN